MAKDFFSKLTTKISDTTKDVTQKTKDVVEMSRLKGQISSEENNIEEAYMAIGKIFFEQNAGEVSEKYVPFFNTINEANAKIAQYKDELIMLKGSYNCPTCGAEVSVSDAFCAGCGAKLEPPVAEASKSEEKAEDDVVEEAEVVIEEAPEEKAEETENN